jgi:hypothetical protein
MLTPMLLVLVFLFPQSATPIEKPEISWLHPGDAAYKAAIRDGFTGKAAIGPYNEDKDGIHQIWFNFMTSRGKDNAIILFAPLRCAQLLGLNARKELSDSPTVSDARSQCDGDLFVTISYSSRFQANSFPLALVNDSATIYPQGGGFTADSPNVSTHWDGLSYQDTYSYGAAFYFKVPDKWTTEAVLRYVVPEDLNANPVNLKINFVAFAKDESAYERSAVDLRKPN